MTPTRPRPNNILSLHSRKVFTGSPRALRITCPIEDCGKAYTRYSSLHNHIKTDHQINIEQQQKLFSTIHEQIKAGVDDDFILNNIHEACYNKELPLRASMITKKDIWNMKQKVLPPYETFRNKNDSTSVTTWVKENQQKKTFKVLFYKGINTTNYGLGNDDFILVIMTNMQAQTLLEFGTDKICVDGTHGTNGYGFQLHTLLVIDEFGSGIPVAFCFSNRQDELVFQIFFQKISEAVGKIKAKTFMTDDAPAYFNSWSHVMGLPENKLLCSWHVSRNWKRASAAKIRNRQRQTQVYDKLIDIKMILNEEEFSSSLNDYLKELEEDALTQAFAKYFRKAYCKRTKTWAYCFRKGLGVNTNMFLESFHNQLKSRLMKGKYCKRMDKAIKYVLLYERDVFQQRNRRLCGHILSTRQRDIHSIHTRSRTVLPDNITEVKESKEWNVLSTTADVAPYVVRLNRDTCNSTCLRCEPCKICFHTYSCTCIDYLIRSNICKHIHACARVFPYDTGFKRRLLEKDMKEKSEHFSIQSTSRIEEIENPANNNGFSDKTKHMGYEIMKAVESGVGLEKLKVETYFTDLFQDLSTFRENEKINTNKKMERQRRF
ncbi:uncharacterized protein LOC113369306 [Ctenocephalides felis]|uniref:uncharacterized protein LOC113369306 n=1 Tax=Ctenocephalides felis TaxID=7515 RepID=UPI000E6E20B9|nr:uncharacterized protein LOC113369306 [Ctenocephalides felis]